MRKFNISKLEDRKALKVFVKKADDQLNDLAGSHDNLPFYSNIERYSPYEARSVQRAFSAIKKLKKKIDNYLLNYDDN